MGIALVTLVSEMIAIVYATIEAGNIAALETMHKPAASLVEYLSRDHLLPWLGVYIHFINGILGLIAMGCIRAWIVLGPQNSIPVLCVVGASVLRMVAAVNQGAVVRSCVPQQRTFIALCARYYSLYTASAVRRRCVSELLSCGLIVVALAYGARLILERLPGRL